MTKVCFLGATDRFNYGDLLFPLILKHKIEEADKRHLVSIENYAIFATDLSDIGAIPTKSIKSLYQECSTTNTPLFVIVIGGEVIGAQWGNILSYLDPNFKKFYDLTNFLFGKYSFFLNTPAAQIILGGKGWFPFIISCNKFPKVSGVIYNAVGGFRNTRTIKHFSTIIKAISSSTYCSFRDIGTYETMKTIAPQAKLSPDSAIIMSTIYSKEFLKQKTLVEKLPFDDYVFFQISKREADEFDIEYIINKLKDILFIHRKNIVLCPIGTALGHEDHIPLQELYKQLNLHTTNIYLASNPGLFDIMGLIAHSHLYIGSSLHGIITAMSYARPYVAIRNNKKISYYLKSWSISPLCKITNKENWDNQLTQALTVEESTLLAIRDKQVKLALKSIDEIIEIITKQKSNQSSL